MASGTTTSSSPSITTSGTLAAVNTTYGTASASPTTFSVSGANMTAGITVTPPTGFEVSQTVGGSSGYAGSGTAITVGSSGTISPTTVYLRLAATAPVAGSPYSGNIVCSSSGATSRNVATASSTVAQKGLTITSLSGTEKTYNGNTTASISGTAILSGIVNSDSLTLGGTPTFAFSTAAVGNSKPITASGYTISGTNATSYTLAQPTGLSANITPAPLVVTANNLTKPQGVALSTPVTGATAFSSSGLIGIETIGSVTISYGTGADAAAAAAVYSGSIVASAAAGGTFTDTNYAISYVAGDLTVTADPTISTTGTLAAVNTTYGTASASPASFAVSGVFLTGDLTVDPLAGFEFSTSATGFYTTSLTLPQSSGSVSATVYVRLATTTGFGTYSGNIGINGGGATPVSVATVSSNVAKKALTITGLTASPKEYDGTTTANVAGTAAYSGLENSESFTPSETVTFAYGDANIGTAKSLARTGAYAPPSANYSITQPTLSANITAKNLTVTGATVTSKVYNGNTAATITGVTLVGVISGEEANVTVSGGGAFASANVGTGIAVTSSLALGGSKAGNYTLTQPTGLAGDITAAPLPGVTFTPPGSLVYSGTAKTYTASATGPSSLTLAYSGRLTTTYSSATAPTNVGDYTVTATTPDTNYSGSSSQNFSVTTKGLTISGVTVSGKVYDGLTTATLGGSPAYVGLVNGETFSVTGSATGTFATANYSASAIAVTIAGYTAPSANYTVTQPTGLTASISKAPLTITSITANNKTYNGSIAATLSGTAAYSGLVNGETFSVTGTPSAVFTSASVGNGKAVTVTGYTAPGANYSVTQPALAANITAAPLTITANNVLKLVGATLTSGTGSTSFSSSGLVNGETIATVSIAYGGAGALGAVEGVYANQVTPSAATGGTFTASNYSITYNGGTITVTPPFVAGDLAIIAYGPNGTDKFAVVFLRAIPQGMTVSFTDNGFVSSTSGRTGEGFLTYTSPADLPAGSVITWENGQTISGTGWDSNNPSSFAFNGSGDQLFAFTGTTANWASQTGITLLYGVQTANTWITTGTASSVNSYQPSSLLSSYLLQFATPTDFILTATTLTNTRSSILSHLNTPANYTTASAQQPLPAYTKFTILVTQTITFGALNSKTYGDATFSLSATASSNLAVSYSSSNTNVATVSGSTVTITGAGTTTITASQAGDNTTFAAATPVPQALTVNKATPTITVVPSATAFTYGQTLADSSLSGGSASVDGSFAFTTPSTAPNAGTASQGVTFTPTDAVNYNTAATTVSVTVTPATLTPNSVTFTPDGNGGYTASGAATSFGYSYSGRSGSSYGPSATIPTLPGLYTVTATSTDANYIGSNSLDYFVAGAIAVNDAVTRQAGSASIKIPIATLLGNDSQVTAGGQLLQSGLSISAVTPGTGNSVSVSGAFVFYTPSTPADSAPLTFTYVLSNGTATATGTVTVSTLAATPFTLDIIRVVSAPVFDETSTSVTVEFAGVPGQAYQIGYSTDMTNWSDPPLSVSTGSAGTFNATFTKAGDQTTAWSSLFFRATR